MNACFITMLTGATSPNVYQLPCVRRGIYLSCENGQLHSVIMSAFLWDNQGQGQWSEITRIIAHQKNRWIHGQSGFDDYFEAPWSEWSRSPPKERTHPRVQNVFGYFRDRSFFIREGGREVEGRGVLGKYHLKIAWPNHMAPILGWPPPPKKIWTSDIQILTFFYYSLLSPYYK